MSAALVTKRLTRKQKPMAFSFGVIVGLEFDLGPFSYLRDDTGLAIVVTEVEDSDDAGGVANAF
jgi:hypothetical protein